MSNKLVKTTDVGAIVREARETRGWSGAQLAVAAGVSRAMIDRVEKGLSSPTTELLGKLSAALGLTMSALLSRQVEMRPALLRIEERPTWVDPVTNYSRKQVASSPTFPVDVTEIRLPAGARITYPAATYAFTRHLIWVLSGSLTFHEGNEIHKLAAGDRLVLGDPVECEYLNRTTDECVYCVVVSPR
ncbi:helix-turn-helix domain-containing protein [Mycetocola zhujimingii]|uniref:helix-turn-helix domain-containing protein n=1 Tax=Mycetocola zhujimingii TaxID=2079792 RepID=UPI000D3A03E1|nr:XRE family transcriptional regulator [Mycetocola zhujimingii]AWB86162.1 LacI family transcriptional regulator [Mycetocola zhujimingii]